MCSTALSEPSVATASPVTTLSRVVWPAAHVHVNEATRHPSASNLYPQVQTYFMPGKASLKNSNLEKKDRELPRNIADPKVIPAARSLMNHGPPESPPAVTSHRLTTSLLMRLPSESYPLLDTRRTDVQSAPVVRPYLQIV